MSEDPEKPVLVYLLRLDGRLDQLIETARDHGRRLTSLGIALGNLAATEMSHYANLALRADQTDARLNRIERRLDLRGT